VNDDELRGLQERVELIKDMSSHPGWNIAVDRAQAQMYMIQKRMIRGDMKTFEEYKEQVSWMSGCQFFMNIPMMVQEELDRELASRAEEED
jgi:hypothetical protein